MKAPGVATGVAMTINKNGTTCCLNGNTWFQPAYGANGVHYRVVAAP
jgi:hypothetical protein